MYINHNNIISYTVSHHVLHFICSSCIIKQIELTRFARVNCDLTRTSTRIQIISCSLWWFIIHVCLPKFLLLTPEFTIILLLPTHRDFFQNLLSRHPICFLEFLVRFVYNNFYWAQFGFILFYGVRGKGWGKKDWRRQAANCKKLTGTMRIYLCLDVTSGVKHFNY